ncbi:MAG: LacI family transcriptional regulator [Rariglobus sp.]|jgi:LacI family transcriptional regulator|nr:LacI family transcriptional regulator [Rariglobus sp.]
MPNQRDIAASLGVTLATVSRALRNSPLVAPGTRRRIQEAAQKMGYVTNPLVATLMEHVRTGRHITDQGTIAILTASTSRDEWLSNEVNDSNYRGMRDHAERRGYGTECFYLGQPGMTTVAVDRILQARGIRAVIVADPTWPTLFRGFPWHRYAACRSAWWKRSSTGLDTVVSDHFHNLGVAFARLQRRGCERIGLCLHQTTSSRWIGAYLFHQSTLPPHRQLPVFQGPPGPHAPAAFRSWYETWKPDAILSGGMEGWLWMQETTTTPERIRFASLNRPRNSPFPGIDENSHTIGTAACDVAINHLMHNDLGLPENPREILIKGMWIE